MERDKYEGELAAVVSREALASFPYFALAWLAAQPTVVAPIASARVPERTSAALTCYESATERRGFASAE
jgi:aryl-alcohol dehydrogenase-like predicted oxidoreductase